MRHKMRKLIVALAAGLLLTVAASPAMAFAPPSNPAGVFNCEGGDVLGHPGSTGQTTALGTGNTFGAWNAHFSSGQITSCAD